MDNVMDKVDFGVRFKDTLMGALGIEFVEIGPEKVVATMPVNEATRQPAGIMHGGASVVLAETVASEGTYFMIDLENQLAVGLEINANHIRSKSEGIVTAVGIPTYKGRKTHVWDVKIFDEDNKLICISRCTMLIMERRPENQV